MALAKCKECSTVISTTAKSCPKCGAQIRKMGLIGKFLLTVFVVGVLVSMFAEQQAEQHKTEEANRAAAEAARVATLTPEKRAAEERQRASAQARAMEDEQRRLGLLWTYSRQIDEMSKGTIKSASVDSINTVDFAFPYNGVQRASLELRNHPRYGKDVILSLEHAQFLCRVDECTVSVRFDGGRPQSYNAAEPSDHSTNTLFIRNYDRFHAGAYKAKKVFIEAQFYQQGPHVFEFSVDGLKW